MGVRDLLISNNLVRTVSQHYREQAAILVTYASGAVIWHNDVSGAPYDGIDIGWGWGVNDPGGSPAYFTASRGDYDQPGVDSVLVSDGAWPAEAQAVIARAGIEPERR